ncbi:MAG: class I SAM-dependent methyltransferase [Planctomycetes bacterium]|nr:class I SAM-dependent methyltransferase [Planctomycetota bacterium]
MEKRQPLISELSRRRKFSLLNEHLAPKSHVLEVGTGDGWFAKRLRECGHHVVTIDLVCPADIMGDILNWRKLGLREKFFDAVVALEVIEHVDCLDAICTLCKEGGLIMLSSPHPKWDWAMKLLEFSHLTQRRTSAHSNLTDFATIDLVRVVFRRPLFIHQVALFRNTRQATDAGDA